MRLKKTYSSREVAALTGLTARQLQFWDAGGLLSPTIPPHRTAAGGLHRTALHADRAVRAARPRRSAAPRVLDPPAPHDPAHSEEQFGQRLFDATGGGGSVQLLTDGRDIYARTDSGAFFNLLKAPGQPLLVVGNEGALKELSGRLRRRRRSPPGATKALAERSEEREASAERVSGSEKPFRDRRPAAE